jgi:ribonuclease BN (tRNA processing enzyme)
LHLRVLGAHNAETESTRLVCLLLDGTLALDAGALTSNLSAEAQRALAGVLITHAHFDHVRDLPALGINVYRQGTLDVHGPPAALDAVASHLLNGVIYARYNETPSPDAPALRFHAVSAGDEFEVGRYRVLALGAEHTLPALAYYVAGPDDRALLYSGDTGPGAARNWSRAPVPDLLVAECTLPNVFERYALESGHLTPRLLGDELRGVREAWGKLPPVLLVHMNPLTEALLADDVQRLAAELDTALNLASEGMEILV